MNVLLYALELVGISVGAGSAFIFDTFFALSIKDHIIKPFEERMLRRINLFTVTGSTIALVSATLLIAFKLQNADFDTLDISLAEILLLGIGLLTSVTLRKIHLPSIVRHQRVYVHLSNSFATHQDSLVSTAIYSTVSWIFLLFVIACEQESFGQILHSSFYMWLIAYILSGLILSKLAIFFKNKFLR
jgi:hypothetical protein